MHNPPEPVLVLCAHGTRDAAGAAVVRRIGRQITRARPGIEVIRGYVDVQSPSITEVTAALSASGRRHVVVPLLLSAGHHVLVDIPAALGRPDGIPAALGRDVGIAAAPLGPDAALADLLVRRLRDAGAAAGDAVVLAAAGSSRAEAAADTEVMVRLLGDRWDGEVRAGYGASASPTVAQAVSRLRARHDRVAVASYLIGPGHFYSRLARSGADLVSAPLGADEVMGTLVLRRYDEARSRTAELSSPAIATATSTSSSA